MLADISFVLLANQPASGLHILKSDVAARIGLIAPHNNRKEQTMSDGYIFEPNIGDVDPRLSLAGASGVEGIEHAAGSASVGLLLLLGAEVDGPPYRFVHGYVLI